MIDGFSVENWKVKLVRKPLEDSYRICEEVGAMAVADGVTRDCTNGAVVDKSLKGVLNTFFYYPSPSPAKISADIFTDWFPIFFRDFSDKDGRAIKESFRETNRKIREWNGCMISDPDYLVDDYAGCVAATAVLDEREAVVSWGYICDSGIVIFDSEGEVVFKTEDEGPAKHNLAIWRDKRLLGKKWSDPEARKIIRSTYRNNLSQENSFGVLTGEEVAMNYVRAGVEELRPGYSVAVYTDGLEHVLEGGKFVDALRQKDFGKIRNLCQKKVRTEGTLVLKL